MPARSPAQMKLDNLPKAPGVYLFSDRRGDVIYIGKAKSLRNRVRSYFQGGRVYDARQAVLRSHIHDVDYLLTDTEVEALILESTLVKQRKPKFNVNLKDDKSFLHIKLTVNEEFPRVLLTRRILNDGALYFGPYLPASLARNTVKIINRHFLLRTCDIEIDGKMDRPCLEYHIQRCLGPCVEGLCTVEQYAGAVDDVVLLLQGKNDTLVRDLTEKMRTAAEEERFEAAAFYRDRAQMVRDLAERQKMILSGVQDVDVFAYHRESDQLALELFTLRDGRVVGKREFYWEGLEFFEASSFLRDAIQQYYLTSNFVPAQIYLPETIKDQQLIAEWLTRKAAHARGRKVRLQVPLRGEKRKLVSLVQQNARIAFDSRFRVMRKGQLDRLKELQRELDLPEIPNRIEAFDVSNIQGAETVASLVVCLDGRMSSSEYRKFKIRGAEGLPDDFASMYEAVHRRYKRRTEEKLALPDLILIDGGKGQLHSAYQALSELGIEDLPLASIAKREEIVFVQGQEDGLDLPRRSQALRLLQEIRDEAHRFAVTYHRKRREKRDFSSELDEIPGIGKKRKLELLRTFGSVARIKQADERELASVVGQAAAKRLLQHWRHESI